MPQLIEATLNEAQRNSLKISEFIFHVVGPDVAEQGGEVDEVQLSDRQREFFLGRLKDVLSGTQYVFQPNAVHLKEKVEQIIAEPENFSEISKQIANDFSGRHGNQMSDGIFVVAVAKYLSEPHVWKNLVLLIKMDKSASFSYDRKQLEGRWVAVMSEVPNALNESKVAIQKSAVVDADGHFAWNVLAYDRVKKPRLGDYFKSFLGVIERQQDSTLTRDAQATVKRWARKLAFDEMPEGEDAHGYAGRATNYLRDHVAFDSDEFIAAVVRDEDPDRRLVLQNSLKEELVGSGVYGQQFVPQPNSLKKKEVSNRYETAEGVQIIFEGDKTTAGLSIETLPNGNKKVVIETTHLTLK
jgi:37-kD nucleoid-associated bacterial protein